MPRCLLCGHAGIRAVPLGPAAQMSELPAWLPDQWKIDNQRKCPDKDWHSGGVVAFACAG